MTRDEAAIERMARAAYAKRVELQDARLGPYSAPCWDALPHTQRSDWIASQGAALATLLADPPPAVERAVLERLREATPAMCKAGDEWQTETDGPYAGEGVSMSAESVWRVMIDARLAELAQGESDGGH